MTDSMNSESTLSKNVINNFSQNVEGSIDKMMQHVDLIIGSLLVILGGILAIYLIHTLAARFLFPHFYKGRLIRVAGITLYALVLLTTALVIFAGLGIDATGIAQMALVVIVFFAVLSFFLLPFIPKLPFRIGHLLEIRGEIGVVRAITPLFTTLERFDGTLVFVSNSSMVTTTIKNFSHKDTRRIEISLSIKNDKNLETAKQTLLILMTENEHVLTEPSMPGVLVVSADAERIDLCAVCWVRNEDWISARSELWGEIVAASNKGLHLAPLDPIG